MVAKRLLVGLGSYPISRLSAPDPARDISAHAHEVAHLESQIALYGFLLSFNVIVRTVNTSQKSLARLRNQTLVARTTLVDRHPATPGRRKARLRRQARMKLLYVLLCFLMAIKGMDTYPRQAITAASPFVQAKGTTFYLESEPFYFAGTNAFYLGLTSSLTDSQVESWFAVAGSFGVTVVRVFAFSNGYGSDFPTPDPIQPELGVYEEMRLDLVLQQAAKNGIRVVLTLTNYEPFLGGWQWWTRVVRGPGYDNELFLIDDAVKCAYQYYLRMILERRNTLTGILYKDDPAIFAFELSNEPHTHDEYEKSRALTPGRMVLGWLGEMSAFIRSIDSNHMTSTGEEGYRADGPTTSPNNDWLNGGLKGVDFVRNTHLDNISFATVHVYPDNWQLPAADYQWIIPNYIDDRAAIAHSAQKPIIMEEFGMESGYLPSRDILLSSFGTAAFNAGYGGMLVWQMWFDGLSQESAQDYNFRLNEPGTAAMSQLVNRAWSMSQ